MRKFFFIINFQTLKHSKIEISGHKLALNLMFIHIILSTTTTKKTSKMDIFFPYNIRIKFLS